MQKLNIKTTGNAAAELKKQAEEIFQTAQELANAVSLVRAMDNLLEEVAGLYSAIDDTSAQAPILKQHIEDLMSLNAILLPKFQTEIVGIYEQADKLSMSALGIIEVD